MAIIRTDTSRSAPSRRCGPAAQSASRSSIPGSSARHARRSCWRGRARTSGFFFLPPAPFSARRAEKGYTYGARTGFDWRRGVAPFALQASVHTAATADAIRDTLTEFDAIHLARPPSDEEVALARA